MQREDINAGSRNPVLACRKHAIRMMHLAFDVTTSLCSREIRRAAYIILCVYAKLTRGFVKSRVNGEHMT